MKEEIERKEGETKTRITINIIRQNHVKLIIFILFTFINNFPCQGMRVTPCLTISAGALRGSSFTGQLFLVSSLILLKHIKCFKVNFNPSTDCLKNWCKN